MRQSKVLPVMLAAALQVMPMLSRVLPLQPQGLAPSAWAIVFKLGAGAVALFGYHAVSSASTATTFAITSTNFSGAVGVPVNFSLPVTNSGSDIGTTFSFATNAMFKPPPSGTTLTTFDNPPDVRGNIVGTPTATVTNLKMKIVATYISPSGSLSVATNIMINITNGPPAVVPAITNQPASLTNVAGTPATFTVTAGGTAPLSYKWRKNTTPIGGATNTSYSIPNVRTPDAGSFTVVITNSAGSVTSSPASLTVLLPPAPALTPLAPEGNQFRFSFTPVVGLTNAVLTNGTVNPAGWNLLTNVPPPAAATATTITDTMDGTTRYYRVKLDP